MPKSPTHLKVRWGRCLFIIAQIILILLALALATHLKDPQLLPYRKAETPVLIVLSCTCLLYLFNLSTWHKALRIGLGLAWAAVLGLTAWHEYLPMHAQSEIFSASREDSVRLQEFGKHLVIGYDQPENIAPLVSRGWVSGLYLTRRNTEGKTLAQLRDEISAFQALRKQAGLPPLMIVSDQEGGNVSRLSPPLPQQPTLSTLITPGATEKELAAKALEYGREQGKYLASLGVNTNFSPVVDLKPQGPDFRMDFHTLIAQRAISPDPHTVTVMGLAYSRGLMSQGITPTLKHFPGLGSANGDTHHFSAHLTVSRKTLETRDWVPFRDILAQTPALLMVGHVMADDIDPGTPASLSAPLIKSIVRQQWHYNGPIITDDMTMAAVYERGLCRSTIQALNADVDLLLVSYDWEKIYPVLKCLLDADHAGSLPDLRESDIRLAHAAWRTIPGQLVSGQ